MKAISLSMFRTKLSVGSSGTVLVSPGDVLEGDPDHLKSLSRNGLVEIVEEDKPPALEDPKVERQAEPEENVVSAGRGYVSPASNTRKQKRK